MDRPVTHRQPRETPYPPFGGAIKNNNNSHPSSVTTCSQPIPSDRLHAGKVAARQFITGPPHRGTRNPSHLGPTQSPSTRPAPHQKAPGLDRNPAGPRQASAGVGPHPSFYFSRLRAEPTFRSTEVLHVRH